MLKAYQGISDLNFSVGHPLQVENYGELKPVYVDPPIQQLTPYQTEQLALTLMRGNRRLLREYCVLAPAIAAILCPRKLVFG